MDFIKKYWWQMLLGLALIGGAIIIINKKRKESGLSGILGGMSENTGINPLDRNLVLSIGMSGLEVMELQRRLKDAGQPLGSTGGSSDGVDGDFGALTLQALRNVKNVDAISLNDYDATIPATNTSTASM